MNVISNLLVSALQQTGVSLLHNWPFLLVGIFVSALLKLYVDPEKASAFLKRSRSSGVLLATGLAVGTPFCSCGTMAVILGMLASSMPWAPIVAFMVASPLTSPEELLYSAGLFGWPFALAFFAASILLGLAGGALAAVFESKGWLLNQARVAAPPKAQTAICACAETEPAAPQPGLDLIPAFVIPVLQPSAACPCGQDAQSSMVSAAITGARAIAPGQGFAVRLPKRIDLAGLPAAVKRIGREVFTSTRQLLPMFLGFAFIGYLINGLIPASWIAAIFGGGHVYSVPLAATIGLPLYINSEGSLPLIRAFLDNGMSQGAALAFLIAGSGTSIGAITGALTIARWRVVGLVIGVLWLGAILAGYGYDLALAFHWV